MQESALPHGCNETMQEHVILDAQLCASDHNMRCEADACNVKSRCSS